MFRSILKIVIAALVVTAVLTRHSAADRPRNHQPANRLAGQTRPIPVGAIKVPLRDCQQPDDYSCGACALMSICSYYDVGPKSLETFKHKLGTDPHEGTYYGRMVDYARQLGLNAQVETPMSVATLKRHLGDGKPVICSIQAWSSKPQPNYQQDGEGHYVVAVGFDSDGVFYFMDPSANYEGAPANPRYGCLTTAELELRWHEDEGMRPKKEPHQRLGIVIWPANEHASPLLQARYIQ